MCLGVLVLLWFAPRMSAARRLAKVRRSADGDESNGFEGRGIVTTPGQGPFGSGPTVVARAPTLVALGIGGLVATALGGGFGLVLGCAAAAAIRQVLRRAAGAAEEQRLGRLAAELPLGTELLTACLAAGALPVEAAEAVAMAVDEPLASELGRVVALLKLGADPVRTWDGLTAGPLEPLGMAFVRSADTGAPLAQLLADLAVELRSQQRFEAEAEARRVGIRAAAPLGLCFLPAFVLLGLVPVVAGLVRSQSL